MNLPTVQDSSPAWPQIFKDSNLGKTYECTKQQLKSCYARASYHGYKITTTRDNGKFSFTLAGRCARRVIGPGPRRLKSQVFDPQGDYPDDNNIAAKLTRAEENLIYWTEKRAMAPDQASAAQAGARVLLWRAEAAALKQKLKTT